MDYLTQSLVTTNDNDKNYQELTFVCYLLCNVNNQYVSGFPLLNRINNLNEDERRVLVDIIDFILLGLEKGREVYGPLELSKDNRDLEKEAREEMRDGLVYQSASKLKKLLNK